MELQIGDRFTVEFSGPQHLLDHDAPVGKLVPQSKGAAQIHDEEEQDHPQKGGQARRQEEAEPLGLPDKCPDQKDRPRAGQQRQQDQSRRKGSRQELTEKEYIDRREQSYGSARSEFMSGDQDSQSGQHYKKHGRDQKSQHSIYPPFTIVLYAGIIIQQIRPPCFIF